jgi:hypothetical protein
MNFVLLLYFALCEVLLFVLLILDTAFYFCIVFFIFNCIVWQCYVFVTVCIYDFWVVLYLKVPCGTFCRSLEHEQNSTELCITWTKLVAYNVELLWLLSAITSCQAASFVIVTETDATCIVRTYSHEPWWCSWSRCLMCWLPCMTRSSCQPE